MMPVQTQMSGFAKKLGGRIAAANAEHKDKPIDVGMMRLPGGIRNGIAKLVTMVTKEYQDDTNGVGTKGQTFFRAAATVVSPEEHNGQRIVGLQTSVVIPLCDIPAKGLRKAKPFTENWYAFQNVFKLLSNGAIVCHETPQTDPTGQKTEAFYFAAMKALTDPTRPPIFISFSTRSWTPPPSPLQPKPEEMVFETWHGLADMSALPSHNPSSGVTVVEDSGTQPEPFTEPPTGVVEYPAAGRETPPADNPVTAEEIAALVELATNDPAGQTEEGAEASAMLEKLAWANGWSKEQTADASDWAEVGSMALVAKNSNGVVSADSSVPSVGSKWKFCKRTKEGHKLKNSNGEEFPPQEVEITTVDPAARTCTVKTIKDGRDVVDIRSKKPVAVKFEWLES